MASRSVKVAIEEARATAPLCACCGKRMAKVIKDIHFEPGTEPATLEEARRRTNGIIVSVKWSQAERYITGEELVEFRRRYPGPRSGAERVRITDETRGRVIYRASAWDGESYRDDVFCTNKCAMRFAYLAHHAGYRIKRS